MGKVWVKLLLKVRNINHIVMVRKQLSWLKDTNVDAQKEIGKKQNVESHVEVSPFVDQKVEVGVDGSCLDSVYHNRKESSFLQPLEGFVTRNSLDSVHNT